MSAGAMPSVFIGHGSPRNALNDNEYTQAWRGFAANLGRPRAILAISAHWYTRGTGVTATAQPETIHDFGGFPDALFQVQYPAPGSPALAARVQELLGAERVAADHRWGLDHGTWSVLRHMYPDADVPVVQLSIDATLRGDEHLELARGLAPLRDEGVLIFGSGNVVHHSGPLRRPPGTPPWDWAERFNAFVRESACTLDAKAIAHYEAHPDSAVAFLTPDHYLPLIYAIGAAGPLDRPRVIVDGFSSATLSMLSLAFE